MTLLARDMDRTLHTKERAARRGRRYAKLAAKKLPGWAPAAIVEALASNFSDAAWTRQERRYGIFTVEQDPDCAEPYCVHCRPFEHKLKSLEDERALLMRLAADNLDMRKAWSAIKTRKRNGPRGVELRAEADPEVLCHSLLQEIKHQFDAGFATIPQQSAAQKKKSGGKIATLARKLIEAIDEDQRGIELARDILPGYLAVKNFDSRIDDGETVPQFLSRLPDLPIRSWPLFSYAPSPTETGYDASNEESLTPVPWDKQPAVERFRWLCDEIDRTDLRSLLELFANKIEQDSGGRQQIPRPNSGNPRVRVLAAALSDWMRAWYGLPLDDLVACFVAAALNLPDVLTRDNIRPPVKRAAGA